MKIYLIRFVVSSFIIATSMGVFRPVNAQESHQSTSIGGGFEHTPTDLNKFAPPSLSNGKDSIIVKEITDKLGVPTIKVYDMPGLNDAIAVKPVPGATPALNADPEFEGIIVDPHYMNTLVDVTEKEIEDMRRLKKDVPQFIEHGRQRRFGVLAHEVAHMLLPADLRGLIGKNSGKKDIRNKVPHVHVGRMLENLHEVSKKLHISSDNERRFANEMAADYVAGGILAYMKVDPAGLKYMLKMFFLGGSWANPGDKTHLGGKTRGEIVQMGYDHHIVE